MQSVKAKSGESIMVEETIHADRDTVIHNLHQVMQRDNSLSRCCAIRGLVRLGANDGESLGVLIDALLDPDPDVRVDAAGALGRLQTADAVEPLLANIEGDPEGDVRIAAVKALAGIGSPRAVNRLIQCIQENGYPELDQMVDDDDFGACWEVQSSAVKALGSIGDAGAAQPLIEFLTDEENKDLHAYGFQVLTELDDHRAEEFVIDRLKNGEPSTRRRAAQALTTMPGMLAGDGAVPAELLGALNDALVDPDPGVRMHAANALSGSSNPMVVVSLTLLLNDPEPEVRNEVASILGRIRGPAIVDRLHDLLQKADPKLKYRLVRVLGEIADPKSYPPLHAVLRLCDPLKDQQLLYETIGALGAIGEPGPENDLAEILANAEMHYTIRVQAAGALGRIYRKANMDEGTGKDQPQEGALAVLTGAVDDVSARVSYAAISALIDIDREQAVEALIMLLHEAGPSPDRTEHPESADAEDGTGGDHVPDAMQEMIGDHGPGTSTLANILAQPSAPTDNAEAEFEIERFEESRREKRALAARLLGGIPDPGTQVMTALTAAAAGTDSMVSKEAIRALGNIADPKSVPVILSGLNAKDDDVRSASLDALENFISMKKVNKRLAALFDNPDAYLRERIVNMLDVDRKPASEVLLRALEDEERKVCRAALARLPLESGDDRMARLASNLIFRFAGELRVDAAEALRRMKDDSYSMRLLEILNDSAQEELHWICIDALAEIYATES
jgi:HEAT repeat protein